METYVRLKKMLCKELEDLVEKGDLKAGSLDAIDKLTHSIKSLDTIMAMEDAGYSNDYGYSGARRRDSMGRYSRDDYNRGEYSRAEAEDEFREHLEEAMHSAPDEHKRKKLERMLNEM